jgi:hypothetical protein
VFPVPAELNTLLNSRTNPNGPFQINKYLRNLDERILDNRTTTFQVIGGLEGTVPGTDWTWEAFGSHGESLHQGRPVQLRLGAALARGAELAQLRAGLPVSRQLGNAGRRLPGRHRPLHERREPVQADHDVDRGLQERGPHQPADREPQQADRVRSQPPGRAVPAAVRRPALRGGRARTARTRSTSIRRAVDRGHLVPRAGQRHLPAGLRPRARSR